MVEAVWVALCFEFVDGKEELDVTVQLQNVFVETPEHASCRCIAVGSNRQQQLIPRSASSACRCRRSTGDNGTRCH